MRVQADSIASNWRFFQKLAPSAECSAVVKADGYGLGAVPVARKLWAEGARSFFVARLGDLFKPLLAKTGRFRLERLL